MILSIPVELLLVDLEEFGITNAYKSKDEMEAQLDLMDVLRSDTPTGQKMRKKLKIKEYKKIINIHYGEVLHDINTWHLMDEHAIRMTYLPHKPNHCNNIIGICK